ncbi:MAG: aminoacetone oxidase family FAD-binding enzyme [Micavibrio sp.]|nr:aminoacetone oxidase family FAD-binding enzyme [Micavibrio sp.]|tara:strand:- start:1007 stop:2191 length:1185 start_codon:yes stop_codon:yes gene_type:complete
MKYSYDVIIIGAGAAGLMCALTAGERGRSVWLVDHAKKIGEKIRISGGGRCNFTNLHCSPNNYLSQNPHFCKSALKQYTQYDFIELVKKHGISFHEKKLGQLFCDNSAQQIIDLLLDECEHNGVKIDQETSIEEIKKTGDQHFTVNTSKGQVTCQSLVIATGGLSIPKIGASKFGYDIARQFGINIIETRAGLVPLTFSGDILDRCKSLSGISVDACVSFQKTHFNEGLLFTHRGLSGPSILQISSYWTEGEPIAVNLANGKNAYDILKEKKKTHAKQDILTITATIIPRRLAEDICTQIKLSGNMAGQSDIRLKELAAAIHKWLVKPSGTEGYRTAEVTLGGVDTNALSSKTMECKDHKGLYFIGEVVDVTGHLGGYNFQWAWSSGNVAGKNV